MQSILDNLDPSSYAGFSIRVGLHELSFFRDDTLIEVVRAEDRFFGRIVKNYGKTLQGLDCSSDDTYTLLRWLETSLDFAALLAEYVECSYCGAYVQEELDRLEYHDYPKPTRQICPGVFKPKAIPDVN